jgi:hypothetical protein
VPTATVSKQMSGVAGGDLEEEEVEQIASSSLATPAS